jgi:ABC-type sugar transport system permease subunit
MPLLPALRRRLPRAAEPAAEHRDATVPRTARRAAGGGGASAPGRNRRTQRAAYLFLLPSAALLLVFVVYPIVQSAWMSLHDWSFLQAHHTFIGFGNYRELWHDPRFWNALRNTLIFTGVTVPTQLLLSLGLATMLVRNSVTNKLVRSIYFFPVISSLATMAIVWKFLLDPNIGLLGKLITDLGGPSGGILQSTTWALPAVMLVSVWKNVGFTMVILLAGMQEIPEQLYEAAAVDGASGWQRFRRITVPGLRQSLLFCAVISVIGSLQLFDQVYVMTDSGPLFHTDTLVTYMYSQGFTEFRSGYAAAIAWVLFALIMIVSTVQLRLFRYRDVD